MILDLKGVIVRMFKYLKGVTQAGIAESGKKAIKVWGQHTKPLREKVSGATCRPFVEGVVVTAFKPESEWTCRLGAGASPDGQGSHEGFEWRSALISAFPEKPRKCGHVQEEPEPGS